MPHIDKIGQFGGFGRRLRSNWGKIAPVTKHHLHYHQLVSKNLESTLCACTEVSSPVVGLGKLVKGGCTFYPQRSPWSYNIILSRRGKKAPPERGGVAVAICPTQGNSPGNGP